MHHIRQGYHGMSVLMRVNSDRLLYGATLAVALWAGAYIGSL